MAAEMVDRGGTITDMTDPSEPVEAEIVEEPAPPAVAPDYDEHGVPSLDYVRDKIEGRWATSVGAGELAAETAPGRTQAEQEADRAKAATAKLAEIRRSMGR